MKRIIAAALASISLSVAFCSCADDESPKSQPFKELTTEEVNSAKVQLLPPDETIQVSDTETLVNLLNNVTIYDEDDAYKDLCGQSIRYTIEKNDGDSLTVTYFGGCMIIDGVGYKCENSSYDDLWSFAKNLQN